MSFRGPSAAAVIHTTMLLGINVLFFLGPDNTTGVESSGVDA